MDVDYFVSFWNVEKSRGFYILMSVASSFLRNVLNTAGNTSLISLVAVTYPESMRLCLISSNISGPSFQGRGETLLTHVASNFRGSELMGLS